MTAEWNRAIASQNRSGVINAKRLQGPCRVGCQALNA